MAENASFIKNVGFDYAAELGDIERRRAMAKALQQQAMQPLEAPPTPPGGFAVPISPWQGAAKVAQGAVGAYGQNQATQLQRELAARIRGDTAADYKKFGEIQQGSPAQPGVKSVAYHEGVGPDQPAVPGRQLGMSDLGSFATPEVRAMARALITKRMEEENKRRVVGPEATLVTGAGLPLFTGPARAQSVTAAGPTGAPETRFVRPDVNAPPIPQPVKKEIAPGGQVYNPFALPTGGVVNDPNKPFVITPEGGITPNKPFQDYQKGLRQAGATRVQTNVNAFTPASEEAQKDFIKSSRATYDQLKQAPVAIKSIEAAKALIPQAAGFMGPAGEALLGAAKFLNNRVGTNINTEGVKSAEELRTRIFFNIMDNLKKMDAQPSQMQQQIMQQALGNLGTDPNALPQVLDAFAGVMKDKVAIHNKEVSSAIARGVKFPYDPIIDMRLDSGGGKVLRFDEQGNPIP